MMRDNEARPPRQRRTKSLTMAAVAVTAAAIGIAGALIFLNIPATTSAASGSDPGGSSASGTSPGYTPTSSGPGSSSSGGGAPSSGTQGGTGGGLPALPPLSGNGGGLQLMLNGKVVAISSTSITLGGNGPNVVAKITSATKVTGSVTSPSGIKVGDQVAAQVSGKSSSSYVANSIQDPA